MSGPSSKPWFENFGQISFAVPEIKDAITFWEQQGIGPWIVYRGLSMNALYEGKPISTPFDVALTWHDGRLIELIQATGDGPSPLHDNFNRPTVGLQRLASITDDIERDAREAVARGMELFVEGEAAGQRFLYYRSKAAPGVILELLERTPSFDAMLKELQERSENYRRMPAPEPVAATGKAAAKTMKAALLKDYGGPENFYFGDEPIPVPGKGEVRVRVAAAGVNPADMKGRQGKLREYGELNFPARLGGDLSGIVDAVGEGVRSFKIGDRLAGFVFPFANGTYGEFVTAPEGSLVPVPEALDLADAAAIPTGVMTGVQLIDIGLMPKPGERVLVVGAGGSTGRAAVYALIDAGAVPIAGVRKASLDLVADLGVETVALDDEAALKALGPLDAIADTIGGKPAEKFFAYLKPQGAFASVAAPAPVPPPNATQRYSSVIVRMDQARLSRYMADMIRLGRTAPIAHRLPLAQAGEAHRLLEQGGVGGKILLIP